MKINLDDPNLTAFALGELHEPEQSTIAQAVAESAEAQEFVRETQQLARLLQGEFRAELDGATEKPLNIMPLPDAQRSFWSDARWTSIGLAALLAVAAVIAVVSLGTYRLAENGRVAAQVAAQHAAAAPGDVQMEMVESTPAEVAQNESASSNTLKETEAIVQNQPLPPPREGREPAGAPNAAVAAAPATAKARSAISSFSSDAAFAPSSSRAFNTAEYERFDDNPFLPATTNPLSTFSIDVDTASYANVRRFINSGTRPPKDAVRIEEMINYFAYDYPQREADQPFSVNLEAASCPWAPDHRLVRIGLKGREIAADKRGASNLVFLLDVSGSMEPQNRLPLVKQAMRLLVDKLTENDRVAIVVYAGASGTALPSTRGDQKEKILAALEELKAGGSTNGAEGIELAYKIAADNFIKGGVNRVILATDGDFNVGVTSQGDLVRLAEEKAKGGVFLTVLGVGDDNLKDSSMQKIADKGNGNYAYLDSLDEARKVLVQQMNGTLVTIAKEVKVQVEFNPARVASYRLIGYEKRMLRKEDFNNDKVDAGEIGAGHTVTALYEVVPVGSPTNPANDAPPVDALKYQAADARPAETPARAPGSAEMLTVKLRHKKPDGDKSELLERPLIDHGTQFANASGDLKFAAAVAEFGMILRGSAHKGSGTLAAVLEWAQEGKGTDAAGYRAGFIDLVRKAEQIAL